MAKNNSFDTKIEFKRGLTWRVIFGLILIALLFIPVNIFLNLSTGMSVTTAAVYVIIILLSMITRYAGNPLSKQELFIIYATTGAVATAIPTYYWLIYRAFFITTPVTYAYKIDGIPLPKLVPDWLCPPVGSSAYLYRTILQPEWIKPVLVFTTLFSLSFIADWSLSIIFSYITVELERLEFPFAMIDVSLIETLTTQKGEIMKIFMAGFYPGLAYGAILYGGYSLGAQIIPLPWADLTWFTEKYVPGAIIGIATDPASFAYGLLLPLSASGSILLGSVIIWILLNYIFTVNPSFFPEWTSEYYSGMTISSIYQRTLQRIWISPQIGFALGLAAALIASMRKSIVEAVSSGIKTHKSRHEYFPSLIFATILYLIGSFGSVILFSLLVPEIPFYVPLLTSLVASFMIGALSSHAVGKIGFFPTVPYLWQSTIYLTPYQGCSGWLVSPYICMGAPGGASQAVKVAYLTETKPRDYFKAWVIAAVLNLVFGLLIIDSFWRLAPIPSSVYPASRIYWPLYATNESLFITRQIRFDPLLILFSGAFSFTVFFAGNLLQKINLPFSAIAFITGCYTLPTSSITIFLGSLIGHYVIGRYIGREEWMRIRGIFVAGVFAGVGVFLGLGVSMILIAKSAWVWPW